MADIVDVHRFGYIRFEELRQFRHSLKSKNAYHRLNTLAKLGYLHRFKRGDFAFLSGSMYQVRKPARAIIEAALKNDYPMIKNPIFPRLDRVCSEIWLQHHLQLSQYIMGFFNHHLYRATFYGEIHIRDILTLKSKNKRLFPDGLLAISKHDKNKPGLFFVEYEQSMNPKHFKEKILLYDQYSLRGFNKRYQRKYFKVLFICQNERHLYKLKTLSQENTRYPYLYFFTTVQQLAIHSPYTSIWQTTLDTRNRSFFKGATCD